MVVSRRFVLDLSQRTVVVDVSISILLVIADIVRMLCPSMLLFLEVGTGRTEAQGGGGLRALPRTSHSR